MKLPKELVKIRVNQIWTSSVIFHKLVNLQNQLDARYHGDISSRIVPFVMHDSVTVITTFRKSHTSTRVHTNLRYSTIVTFDYKPPSLLR